MGDIAVHERLRQVRQSRGEDLSVLARRIGVRKEHLQAIEDGRFGDLPPGIYGRAAVRSFAVACGFDPVEILAACEPLLPGIEEPISAIGRLRGVRQPRADSPPEPFRSIPVAVDPLDWRPLAAAALDALVVVTLLLVVVICAATALLVPITALGASALSLTVMGIILAGAYFMWFGGLGGATIGERVVGIAPEADSHPQALLTLRAIASRAVRSATEDVRCIQRLGSLLGTLLATYRSPV